jgi:radical SAM superfamily enzyme YgiQ (UPF0313 family)
MKVVLATINAKYIHTSLALRLLYVANKERFDISFREYTLKEDVEKMANELVLTGCDVIGLGVYIWNVRQIRYLVGLLKEKNPALILILGGPEVTYEPAFFLDNWPVDYIVSGEGEFVLGELLEAIQKQQEVDIEGVSSRGKINKTIASAVLSKVIALPSPYKLPEDRENMQHRVVYFETSRGCPFHCQFCLASLDKEVRYFPITYIFENLEYLIDNGAKQIKFLDRTFNINKQHSQSIFDFLFNRYRPNLSCQFEIYADLLQEEMIDYLNEYLPDNYFRFEIGIQSTYEPANQAIRRKQDFQLLASNIQKLMQGGKIDLHLDLIAGLPFESFERFVKSFNDVFDLKAKEVQMGFLKMLRGTGLRRDAATYGYRYDEEAPYEVRSHDKLSESDLNRIHRAEQTLEKYWNSGRFSRTMKTLFDSHYQGRCFELFDEIGTYWHINQLPEHGYQLEDLFRHFNDFLFSKDINLFTTLRTDYYHCFSTRPPGFWKSALDKKTRKRLLCEIGNDKEFLNTHNLNRRIIEKRAAIDPVSANEYLLTVFPENKREIQTFVYQNNAY